MPEPPACGETGTSQRRDDFGWRSRAGEACVCRPAGRESPAARPRGLVLIPKGINTLPESSDDGEEGAKVALYIEPSEVDQETHERLRQLLERSRAAYWKQKRLFDIVVSSASLLLLIPVFAVISAAIWLDDPHGGPIFKQIRIGRHGKPFVLYKFRTMVVNAEALREELLVQNEMDGPVFKIRSDPRITRVGRFLRRVSLDELPQLFNVLKGDMSMVGPRPPLPGEVELYTDYQRLRLIVTPGLTCQWQVSPNRNDIPFQQWVEMDLDYIQHRTMLQDIKLILKTPGVMLRRGGR